MIRTSAKRRGENLGNPKEGNFQKRNRIGVYIQRTSRGWRSARNKNAEYNASV